MIVFAEVLVFIAVLGGFAVILGIMTLFSDYIFPRIPAVKKFIDSLPEFES